MCEAAIATLLHAALLAHKAMPYRFLSHRYLPHRNVRRCEACEPCGLRAAPLTPCPLLRSTTHIVLPRGPCPSYTQLASHHPAHSLLGTDDRSRDVT